jgi:hypothetical protein
MIVLTCWQIRMAMETVIGLAIATGRTLVLPPSQRMYLLGKDRGKQRTDFDFDRKSLLKEPPVASLVSWYLTVIHAT